MLLKLVPKRMYLLGKTKRNETSEASRYSVEGIVAIEERESADEDHGTARFGNIR